MLGWFIVLVPTAIIVMYVILYIVLECNKYESKFYSATVISIVCVIITALAMLCSHGESRSFIAKYEGAATEYKIRSDTFSMPERVSAFNYAINLTAEAAAFQYWNRYFDPFIPDKINDLKPIR